MEYRCISADCHIDLWWLPHDLFVSNASNAMKDRMPYVTQGSDGPIWVTKSGLNLGLASGNGVSATHVERRYVPGLATRVDRMASTGLYADGAKNIFRPTTPELRLQDQERDGIQAEVMYGLHNAGSKMTDREATIEFYRIYNDWLSDFCNYDRKRFVGLASIPSQSVEAAEAEARRVAKIGGVGGLDFLARWDMVPLWDSYWDPFWRAAAEANLPVHFHAIAASSAPVAPVPIRDDLPDSLKKAHIATRMAGTTLRMAPILAAVIHGGALERYPGLRVVFAESGIGWIPYVLDRMDYEYEDQFKGRIPLKMKPSDYWRRQCRSTFQYDTIGVMLLDTLGVETVMWASDYPHPDGVFPDSQEYIKRQFSHLPSATQRKITCENAGKLYGLIPS